MPLLKAGVQYLDNNYQDIDSIYISQWLYTRISVGSTGHIPIESVNITSIKIGQVARTSANATDILVEYYYNACFQYAQNITSWVDYADSGAVAYLRMFLSAEFFHMLVGLCVAMTLELDIRYSTQYSIDSTNIDDHLTIQFPDCILVLEESP